MPARGLTPVRQRQREGFARRVVDELCGTGAADMVADASRGHYGFVPILGGRASAHDGELYAGIRGGSPFADWNEFVANQSTAAEKQMHQMAQVGTANVVGRGSSLWNIASGKPAAGSAPTGLAGNALDRTNSGALGQSNPAAGTLHIGAVPMYTGTAVPHCLILIDRIMHWRPTTTSGAQTLTGTPGRYQTTPLAQGNVLFNEIATVLPATAHTPTYTYTDQAGNAGATSSPAGISAGAANTFDHAGWFIPLASGDTGVRTATAFNVGTTLASGALNIVLAKPLLYMPITGASYPHQADNLNMISALPEVLTDACLSHIVWPGVTTATTFTASYDFVESN